MTPTPSPHNPTIHIQPPTNASSTPSLDIPQTYVPPAERQDSSPPNEHGNEKRVQWASSPAPRGTGPNDDRHRRSKSADSDDISPDVSRQRRRHHETNRGYEASDDTDFSPNDNQRGNHSRDQSTERGEGRRERNGSRRLKPEDNNYGRRRSSDSRQDKRSSRSSNSKGQSSPDDTDDTVEYLPDRFDDKGRRKSDKGDDPLADKIDEILKGKGAAGKVFGNFMDGLLGPQGRKKNSDDPGEGGSRRRRD